MEEYVYNDVLFIHGRIRNTVLLIIHITYSSKCAMKASRAVLAVAVPWCRELLAQFSRSSKWLPACGVLYTAVWLRDTDCIDLGSTITQRLSPSLRQGCCWSQQETAAG